MQSHTKTNEKLKCFRSAKLKFLGASHEALNFCNCEQQERQLKTVPIQPVTETGSGRALAAAEPEHAPRLIGG